jgi:hypothetical protein
MKKIIYFLLLLSILSCHKDPLCELAKDEARLQGYALEKGTKKPVEGVRLYLTNCASSLQFGSFPTCTVIDSTKTDKNGYYSFTYKYKGKYDGSSFDLRANVSDSYYKRGRFETIGPTDHLIWDYNLELIPKAWVKVHIKNINPFNDADLVWVSGGWSGALKDDRYYGKTVDLFIKKEIIGNDSLGISWDITKNNIDYFKTSKVYCPALDTTYFEILY